MSKIVAIDTVNDLSLGNVGPMNGANGSQLGMSHMINAVFGGASKYDGYKVATETDVYHILIDNGQSCCESWGYLSSDDKLSAFIGAELIDVTITDIALNAKAVEDSGYYGDGGGIKFVDFKTDKGVLQLAVYNAHNGYYGHPIIIAKNEEVLLSDTL